MCVDCPSTTSVAWSDESSGHNPLNYDPTCTRSIRPTKVKACSATPSPAASSRPTVRAPAASAHPPRVKTGASHRIPAPHGMGRASRLKTTPSVSGDRCIVPCLLQLLTCVWENHTHNRGDPGLRRLPPRHLLRLLGGPALHAGRVVHGTAPLINQPPGRASQKGRTREAHVCPCFAFSSGASKYKHSTIHSLTHDS